MKRITIKTMTLVNFKGIQSACYQFDEKVTSICGRNGLGKTTIFDAFTWVLFGKDSHDNKKFNIKTLDSDGNVIPRIPHEVTVKLEVNGEEISLRRTYTENWVRRRGTAEEEFTGHTEKRFWNDVEISARDYDQKINDLCSEQTFKFITNPLYFSSQKSDVQRTMLFSLAGEPSLADIAEGDEEFAALLDKLTGKTMEEYRKEIQAKKRVIKQDLDSLPARIDERKMNAPKEENWTEIENAIAEQKMNLSVVSDRLNAENEARKMKAEEISGLNDEFFSIKPKISEREAQVRFDTMRDWNRQNLEITKMKSDAEMVEVSISSKRSQIASTKAKIESLTKERNALLEEYRQIKNSRLTFDDGEFTCPTCGRKYDIDDILSKQEEMAAKFNQDKAKRLAANKDKGLANKAEIDANMSKVAALENELAELEEKKTILTENAKKYADKIGNAPDADAAVASDDEVKKLRQMQDSIVESIKKAREEYQRENGTSDYEVERNEIVAKIEELNRKLAARELVAQNNERIAQLTRQFKSQSEALALLEGEEYTVTRFAKARTLAIEGRVNAMFDNVKFKLFDTQINGGEVETCEATVNGVPYSDLNSAMKINAGIEIINAICRKEEIYAPCFVDNAETVNTLHPTDEQLVRLVVTLDDALTIN